MTASGPPVPPPPPGKPGTPPPVVVTRRSEEDRERDKDRRRRRKSVFWRTLEFLDFPMLVTWLYGFGDLFSSKGNEIQKRRRRRKRLALVAMMCAIGGGTYAVATRFKVFAPPAPDFTVLVKEAEKVQNEGKHAEALQLWEELEELRTEHGSKTPPENLYLQAKALDALGQKDEARKIMKFLITPPLNHPGAHMWMAEDLIALDQREDDQKIIDHMDQALKSGGFDAEPLRKLAQRRLKKQDVRGAIADYERLAEYSAEDRLLLAVLYAANRQGDEVARPARSALGEFKVKLDQKPEDLKIRMQAVQAALLLKDFSEAHRLLNEGLRSCEKQEDDEKLRLAIGAVNSEWAVELSAHGSDDEAVAKLVESLRYAPEHGPTLDRLAALAQRPSTRESARAALTMALFQGDRLQGAIYGLLARLAEREGRRRESRLEWQLAAATAPGSVVPYNELAISYMAESPPDLAGALALVEKGLALTPADPPPQLLATRGRILALMGKFNEALPDLQAALNSAAANSQNDPVLHAALYDVYIHKNMPQIADMHFQQAVAAMPLLWISRVRMAQQARDRAPKELQPKLSADADRISREAVATLKARLENDPRNAQKLLLAAEAQVLSGDYEGAVKLLEPALGIPNHEESLRRALSQVYVEWGLSEKIEPKNASPERLKRLEKSVFYNPANRRAIQELSAIARAKGTMAGVADAMLNELLNQKPPSAMASFVLGTAAWGAGDKAEARRLLEQAYKVDPTLTDLPNNLAWVLSHSEPEDIPRALNLVETALQESPEHPNYRGTRGHLMARMKRWAEARVDLEHALKYREDADNRRVLNEAYKELGLRGPGAAEPKGAASTDEPGGVVNAEKR